MTGILLGPIESPELTLAAIGMVIAELAEEGIGVAVTVVPAADPERGVR